MKRLTLEELENVSGGDGYVPPPGGLPSTMNDPIRSRDPLSPYYVDEGVAP
jgi:hypothetical protein